MIEVDSEYGLIFKAQSEFREAVEMRFLSMAKKYLTKGADPNFVYKDGLAIIHILATEGDVSFFRKLQELCGNCLNVNLKSPPMNLSPLIYASQASQYEFMEELLRLKADPNYIDKRGKGALHYAAQGSKLRNVQLLLQYNANTMKPDVYNNSPLFYSAIHYAEFSITQLLLDVPDLEETEDLFLESVFNCNSEVRRKITMYLVQCGANIDYKQPVTLRNCLHIVALTNYLPLARDLVFAGANLNHFDITRRLPIHVAEDCKNVEVHAFFLKMSQKIERRSLKRSTWKMSRTSVLSSRSTSSLADTMLTNVDNDDDKENNYDKEEKTNSF